MTEDDDLFAIAARIADGSGVDWSAVSSTAPEVEDLRAIAQVAALHRDPSRFGSESTLADSRWGPLSQLSKIGEGRFGSVYSAWYARLQLKVALKLLHAVSPAASASPSAAVEEARLLARVRHPNVLAVYGAEVIDGQAGIWTEFIEGQTLEARLAERGPLSPEEVVAIGLSLCRALSAVHEAGLLHRDIKAQNVMRETGGRIVLMDFGTGHDLEQVPPRQGDLTGTPLYLAPELFRGDPPGPTTDVYALAVLLYRLLTGAYPVPGRTLDEVRAEHLAGRATVRVRDVRMDVPKELARAIDVGLATDAERRPQSARAFEAALLKAQRVLSQSAVWRSWANPRGLVAAAVLVGGLTGLAAVGFRWWQRGQAPGVQIVRLPPARAQDLRAFGPPSHDGRFLPYVDPAGNVAIWQVATARSRRLTDNATPTASATRTLLSPTANQIAFVWASDGGFSLEVLNTDGTWPHVLVGHETAFEPMPVDWSRDGRRILCWFSQRNGSRDLVLVPVDGSHPILLATVPVGGTSIASLSPDGRFAAYFAARPNAPSPAKSLFIVGMGGSPTRAVLDADPGDDSPMWLPGGGGMLFLRATKSGSRDAWTVEVANGIVHGTPRRRVSALGYLIDPALTDEDALFAVEVAKVNELYTASIDLTGRAAVGPPTRISRTDIGQHVSPRYSPDGRSIAYFTLRPSLPGLNPDRSLSITDVLSGASRTLDLKLEFVDGHPMAWLPDSKSLVLWGADDRSADRFGYFRVNVETSAITPVLITGHGVAPFFECSGDGRALLYVDRKRGVVRHDLSTGEERTVIRSRPGDIFGPFRVSPVGGAVALTLYGPGNGDERIAIEVPDGTRRPLGADMGNLALSAWTPDGRNVLVLKVPPGDGRLKLFSLPVTGGEGRDLHFSVNPTNAVVLSPDGSHMAYGESDAHGDLRIRTAFSHTFEIERPGK